MARLCGAQTVTGTVSNTTRVESWSYFQPREHVFEPSGDPDYTYVGDRAELSVTSEGERFDLSGAFNYVRLENLPKHAIGPGGFGPGAFYFAASGVNYSYQLYTSGISARVKWAGGRRALAIGRMPFSSGRGAVLNERLSSRLLGNFEASLYQRRFDGARFDADSSRWHLTTAAFVPTQGGYEESTNLSMPRVQVGVAELTTRGSHDQVQAFAYGYRDRRRSTAVVDNNGSLDRPVQITIATFGGSYARVAPLRSGQLDTLAWVALQAGDWYGRSHRAASIAAESGYRWSRARWRPWLRAGYLWASGDKDPVDGTHGTFFPMLPSTQQYAGSSVYTQMNLRDLFAQVLIEPPHVRARLEVHQLGVASGADLWYQGSGATASRDRFFGYSGRFAAGGRSLGTLIEGAIDVPIREPWSIRAYAASMSSGDVVQHSFTSKRLTTFSIENVIRFTGSASKRD